MRKIERAYGGGQKWLHWTVALLVIGLVPAGILMGRLPESPVQDRLYNMHRSFGMLVLALMLVRIVLRLRAGAAPKALGLTRFEQVASTATHHILYLLLLAVPLVGWLAMSAYGGDWSVFGLFQPPRLIGKSEALSERLFGLHFIAALCLGALALMHVGAALKHRFVKKDGVLQRMLPEAKDSTS